MGNTEARKCIQYSMISNVLYYMINKITRGFIFEAKKAKMSHFIYNCIFDSTNKCSSLGCITQIIAEFAVASANIQIFKRCVVLFN